MNKQSKQISEELWEYITKILIELNIGKNKKGRPPKWDFREILESIYWILKTGCQWSELKERESPPKSTVHYWFQRLREVDFFNILVNRVGGTLLEESIIDLSECSIDGTFVRSKHKDDLTEYGKQGKGHKIMLITEKRGMPVAARLIAANQSEVKQVEETIDSIFVESSPSILLGDKAYDSDKLDEKLREEREIRLVSPHKKNRKKDKTQDGRELRRMSRRFLVERCNAWLHNYRKIHTRYEKNIENYFSFLLLAISSILAKRLIKSTF